jgi:hypothetical protein
MSSKKTGDSLFTDANKTIKLSQNRERIESSNEIVQQIRG